MILLATSYNEYILGSLTMWLSELSVQFTGFQQRTGGLMSSAVKATCDYSLRECL